MADYGLILCLILTPIALRWITVWQMRRFCGVALNADQECKKMTGELSDIREATYQVERQESHYAARRSNLHRQIEAARAELAKLRRPAKGRIAVRPAKGRIAVRPAKGRIAA